VISAVVVIAVMASLIGGGGGSGGVAASVTVDGPPRTSTLPVGGRIPNFVAPALGGGEVRWSNAAGKARVLMVWAPWCPHCQADLPRMAQAAASYPSVELVSVTTAVNDHPGPTPQQFMDEFGLTFPVGLDDVDGTIAQALGLTAFPLTYYVNPDGTIANVTVGESSMQEMQAALQEISAA
jgi:thiol-disulfide isomerase/thioredoxin